MGRGPCHFESARRNALRQRDASTTERKTIAMQLDFASFFFSSRGRHTRFDCDRSSDVCSSDLWAIVTVVLSTPATGWPVESTTLTRTGPIGRPARGLLGSLENTRPTGAPVDTGDAPPPPPFRSLSRWQLTPTAINSRIRSAFITLCLLQSPHRRGAVLPQRDDAGLPLVKPQVSSQYVQSTTHFQLDAGRRRGDRSTFCCLGVVGSARRCRSAQPRHRRPSTAGCLERGGISSRSSTRNRRPN